MISICSDATVGRKCSVMMRSGVAREQLDEGTTYGQWHEVLRSEVYRRLGMVRTLAFLPPHSVPSGQSITCMGRTLESRALLQDNSGSDFREYILCYLNSNAVPGAT
jgi:hypothetical protein